MAEKIKHFLKKALEFLFNPRLLLCAGIAWMITNGWSYMMFALGSALHVDWMVAVAGGYLVFLWLPISPEKIVTAAIALLLLKLWFPQDEKTLAVLTAMSEKAKNAVRKKKE